MNATSPGRRAQRPRISPRARRAVARFGLDAASLRGSGPNGRIVEADVRAAAAHPTPAVAGRPRPGTLTTMRRVIAERTAHSFATAPHFYLRAEVDLEAALLLREQLLPDLEQATGVRLTLTDLLLRAQALALRDCPHANRFWQDNALIDVGTADVGLVVGLDDGLFIPIVRAADRGSLADLVRRRHALVEAARAGRLQRAETQGGATSLSNLGPSRVDEFAAVIYPPQSTLLAVGRAAPRPVVRGGRIEIGTTLRLCLSVDHRVMDGGPAAAFLGRIVERLEQPDSLLEEVG